MSTTQQLTPLGSALAGALGACFSNAVVYPLDVAKTRIQATNGRSNAKALSVYTLLLRILREEGIVGYFKGFGATMLNTFSQQYAYFFFYSLVRGTYTRRLAARNPKNGKAPILSTAAELALGALAGALAQIFTIPVSVIATRQQLGRSDDRKPTNSFAVDAAATAERKPGFSYANAASAPPAPSSAVVDPEKAAQASLSIPPSYTEPPPVPISPQGDHEEAEDDSFLGVARAIIKEEGPTGLWLGLRPGLVLTVNPAITYGAFERLKSGLLPPGSKLSPGMAFMLGAFSKTLATIVTYPYIMAKVRIQTRTKSKDGSQVLPSHRGKSHVSEGALDILQRVYREEGPVGWYRGMGAQIAKAVLSQGVLFMSKDQFERWALVLMATLYRMQQSRA